MDYAAAVGRSEDVLPPAPDNTEEQVEDSDEDNDDEVDEELAVGGSEEDTEE